LINLELMTMNEVCKIVHNYNQSTKPKCTKAINLITKKVSYYKSMNSAAKELGINNGVVKHVCDKKYGYKKCTSKKDGCKYKFEHVSDREYQRRMADKK